MEGLWTPVLMGVDVFERDGLSKAKIVNGNYKLKITCNC